MLTITDVAKNYDYCFRRSQDVLPVLRKIVYERRNRHDLITPFDKGKEWAYELMIKWQPRTAKLLLAGSDFYLFVSEDLAWGHDEARRYMLTLIQEVNGHLIEVFRGFYGSNPSDPNYQEDIQLKRRGLSLTWGFPVDPEQRYLGLPGSLAMSYYYRIDGLKVMDKPYSNIYGRLFPFESGGQWIGLQHYLGMYRLKKYLPVLDEMFPYLNPEPRIDDESTLMVFLSSSGSFTPRKRTDGDLLFVKNMLQDQVVYYLRDGDVPNLQILADPGEAVDRYCEHILLRKEGRFDFRPWAVPFQSPLLSNPHGLKSTGGRKETSLPTIADVAKTHDYCFRRSQDVLPVLRKRVYEYCVCFDHITPLDKGKEWAYDPMIKWQPRTAKLLLAGSDFYFFATDKGERPGQKTNYYDTTLIQEVNGHLIEVSRRFYGSNPSDPNYPEVMETRRKLLAKYGDYPSNPLEDFDLPESLTMSYYYRIDGLKIMDDPVSSVCGRLLPMSSAGHWIDINDDYQDKYRLKKYLPVLDEMFPNFDPEPTTRSIGFWIFLSSVGSFTPRKRTDGDLLFFEDTEQDQVVYYLRDGDVPNLKILADPGEAVDHYCEHILLRKEGRFDFRPWAVPFQSPST